MELLAVIILTIFIILVHRFVHSCLAKNVKKKLIVPEKLIGNDIKKFEIIRKIYYQNNDDSIKIYSWT